MKMNDGAWSGLRIVVAVAGVLSACVAACSGSGKVSGAAQCDSGACSSSGSGGGSGGGTQTFPFSGPSCTGASFGNACWQCVDASCASADCITSECGDFFTCFCACAMTDTACQGACSTKLQGACQSCAQSITACQQKSCSSQCGTGTTQTVCTTERSCPGGGGLVACTVAYGGLCQSQYYEVNSQTFPCAACGDCTAAASSAGAACP